LVLKPFIYFGHERLWYNFIKVKKWPVHCIYRNKYDESNNNNTEYKFWRWNSKCFI
jgi:hypothetical protein